MRIHRQRQRGPFSPVLKVILIFVLVVGISLSLAWVWHTTEQSSIAAREQQEQSQAAEPHTASSPQEGPPPQEAVVPVEASTEEEPQKPETGGAVPESAAVENSYFDDAIFFGDSISTGIPLYHVADNAVVIAMTGINTDSVNTKKCIDIGAEERVTFLEAARQYGNRKKVYIMLGGNGLDLELESYIGGYKVFIDSVKEQYPDAVIYLQSITPVVSGYVNEIVPEIDNDLINERNQAIMELAKRENIYYLDVASALKNEQGALPDAASPTDGMHFTPEYYHKWFDYLKRHTVAMEGKK